MNEKQAPPMVPPALNRLPSGVPGLDNILSGGFFRSGVYIIQGHPGCGKTILANQICFAHARAGGTAVYATLLAESHVRMLQHLGRLSFFDPTAIPDRLNYVSAFSELQTEGLTGLTGVLRREMRARKATVLVLDGLVAAADSASTDTELKKFIHEIQSNAVFHGCTVFLLTSGGDSNHVNAEHTMVDGLLQLEDRLYEARAERSIQVRKFRGAAALRGKHAFVISDDGIEVFPRIEALYRDEPDEAGSQGCMSSGVPTLDKLIEHGGISRCSSTVVIGSTGTGKTTLGIQFLGRSSPAEPGLLFGFFESPARVRAKAAAIGVPWEQLERDGSLRQMWHPQGEHVMDKLGHELLEAVSRHGVRRLVIDGLSGFFESAVHVERVTRFFSCLVNELRRRGVTTLMTLETRDAIGSTISTQYGISGFVDNLLFVRFALGDGQAKRLLSIIKLRDCDYDPGVHELHISGTGIRLAGLSHVERDVIPSAAPVSERPAGLPQG